MDILFIVGLLLIIITATASYFRWKNYDHKIATQYFLPLFIGTLIFFWFYITEYILHLSRNIFAVNYYLIRIIFLLDVLFLIWVIFRDLFGKDKK